MVAPHLALPANQVTPVRLVPLLPRQGKLLWPAQSICDLLESIHQLVQNITSLLVGPLVCHSTRYRVFLFNFRAVQGVG